MKKKKNISISLSFELGQNAKSFFDQYPVATELIKKQKIGTSGKEAGAILSAACQINGRPWYEDLAKMKSVTPTIGPPSQKLTQPPDWPADAPPYHTPAGWAWEKQMAEYKLRETFGREARNWNCIDWFLYMAGYKDDMRFYLVATRLAEIERGE